MAKQQTTADGPHCQSCGEPLLWVENSKTGNRLPLVRTPVALSDVGQLRPGMVVVSPSKRKGAVLKLEDIEKRSEAIMAAAADGRVHTSHFAGCAQAQDWTGRRRA